MAKTLLIFIFSFSFYSTLGIDNGLGITPPLGWRSWNCYHGNISQSKITGNINAVLDKSRSVDGTPISLAEIGYNEMGIDDNWQVCDSTGHYFHNSSAPFGWPVLNTQKFPDLQAMINYAHDNKIKIDWYFNNCICKENNPNQYNDTYPSNEVNDVNFLRMYDFDGVKLDACGTSKNITNWERLINQTGKKPLLIENSWNGQPAHGDWCPFNFFRMSQDIPTIYPSIIAGNLQPTTSFQQYPTGFISRPSCWAHPDMLQVGNIPQQYNATQNDMDQTHFSAWCIVSAPLILGFDLTNNETMNRVWNIITNPETIAVNQNWAGHPGRQINKANYSYTYENIPQNIDRYGKLSSSTVTISGFEIWAKPQLNNAWAVLLMNNDGNHSHDVTVKFSDVPWSGSANLRDIINHKDLGSFSNSYTAKAIPPFGSTFLLFTK